MQDDRGGGGGWHMWKRGGVVAAELVGVGGRRLPEMCTPPPHQPPLGAFYLVGLLGGG